MLIVISVVTFFIWFFLCAQSNDGCAIIQSESQYELSSCTGTICVHCKNIKCFFLNVVRSVQKKVAHNNHHVTAIWVIILRKDIQKCFTIQTHHGLAKWRYNKTMTLLGRREEKREGGPGPRTTVGHAVHLFPGNKNKNVQNQTNAEVEERSIERE